LAGFLLAYPHAPFGFVLSFLLSFYLFWILVVVTVQILFFFFFF